MPIFLQQGKTDTLPSMHSVSGPLEQEVVGVGAEVAAEVRFGR